jgi:hypothetical protein
MGLLTEQFAMDDHGMLLIRVLFWSLAVGSAVLPMRWALLGFILLSHIDITSSSYASATNIGTENAIKTVVLPSLLFARFAWRREDPRGSVPLWLWILLITYAAVACLWSPFQLSGIKMVAYMYCYLVAGACFLEGWKRNELTPNLIAVALWTSLLMAVFQTYVLGNEYGRLPGFSDDRLTSFCSPQQFGAFLLAMLSILFVTARHSLRIMVLNGLAGFCGIILCGSRYVFLGSLFLLPIVWISHVVRHVNSRVRLARLGGGIAILFVGLSLFGVFITAEPDNRISQLVTMTVGGQSPLENIGTVVWRRGIYEQVLKGLSDRGPLELVFGTGTSSGAKAVLGWDRRYFEDRVDANRVVHNEFLRVIFEWGIVGIALFCWFGAVVILLFWKAARHRVVPAYAFLALLPTIVLGCLSENVLAGSALPGGVGFSLALFYGWSYFQRAGLRPGSTTRLIWRV